MFNLSLVELLFIAVVGLIVIGPKDLPKVIASGLRLLKQFKSAMSDIRAQVDELVEESGLEETRREVKTLIDDNGKIQEVYDISDFLDEDGNYKISGTQADDDKKEQP